MKKNKGSNLVEYAIPLALIGAIVGVGLYNLCTDNSILNYIMGSGNMTLNGDNLVMKNANNISTAVISNAISEGSSSGSGSTATSTATCSDNTCSINFGEITLNAVPKDLNAIVETSGVSGGMDSLIGLLDQIAAQYEAQGKTEQALEIKKLSTTGHNMALVQKDFENFVFNTCKGDAACFKSYSEKNFPKPAGYDETYLPFPTGIIYDDAPWITSIGANITDKNNYPECKITDFYNETLNKIKNDSSISDSVKGLIQELTWDIGTVAQTWTANLGYIVDPDPTSLEWTTVFDPLTGKKTTINYESNMTTAKAYANLQDVNAPGLTNVDSGLICASGGYSDSGTSCH